jgi:putative transposase
VPDSELQRIRESVQRGQLLANASFAQELSDKLGSRLELRGAGRPRKSAAAEGAPESVPIVSQRMDKKSLFF